MIKTFKLLCAFLLLCLSFSHLVSANEGDDTIGAAKRINVNQIQTDVVSSYNDKNFYQFTLPMDGLVTVSVSNQTNASWRYQLYFDDGKDLGWSDRTDNSNSAIGNSESSVGLKAGTYYLKIEDYWDTKKAPYSFQVKYIPGDNYEKEDNDQIKNANSIKLDTIYKANLQYSSDVDFYKFIVPSNGMVTISIPNQTGYSWKSQLYYENGNKFDWYDNTNYSAAATGNTESSVGLPPGTYYLQISKYYSDNYEVPYTFQVKYKPGELFEQEYNNDVKHASPLLLNNKYTASLQYSSDIDFYKFNVPVNAKVSINLSNRTDASWYYQLYNSDGSPFDWYDYTDDSNSAKGSKTTTIGLKAGDYYLKVSDKYDSSGYTYHLNVSARSIPLNKNQIEIKNNKGAKDSVMIKSLKPGDIVKVYTNKGKLIQTSKAVLKDKSSLIMNLPQIGKTAGVLYFSVVSDSLLESNKVKISFSKEK